MTGKLREYTVLVQLRIYRYRSLTAVRPWKVTVWPRKKPRLPFPPLFRGELLNFRGVLKTKIAMIAMDPDWRCIDPIENGDFPASYVSLPEGIKNWICGWLTSGIDVAGTSLEKKRANGLVVFQIPSPYKWSYKWSYVINVITSISRLKFAPQANQSRRPFIIIYSVYNCIFRGYNPKNPIPFLEVRDLIPSPE